MIFACSHLHASNLYWIGGNGNWTNPSKWSLTSGGSPAHIIPDATDSAIFDVNSGLTNNTTVVIPEGDHEILEIKVQGVTSSFKFLFNGANGTVTNVNIYGELLLLSTHEVIYGAGTYNWNFKGQAFGSQNITTGGNNMKNVIFTDESKSYNLLDALNASNSVNVQGGSIKTNSNNITTNVFKFLDNQGSCCPYDKELIAGTSIIDCTEFNSKFTYGSLTMNGDFTIRAEIFGGSQVQSGQSNADYHNIYLKDYQATDSYLDNNFLCASCEIDQLIIENKYSTKLAGSFTIKEVLEVQTSGTSIFFNSANGMGTDITIEGIITTPVFTGCPENRVIWDNVSVKTINFIRNVGTLTLEDSEIYNISAVGNATFNLVNSLKFGNSSGWTVTNTPSSETFLWTGNAMDSLWHNPDNWSVGGNSNGCTPSINDDVILNNTSATSQTHILILPGEVARCRNVSRTSNFAPLFIHLETSALEPYSTIEISGNCVLPGNVNFVIGQYLSAVHFLSPNNNNIRCEGIDFPNVHFKGGGTWNLLEELKVRNIIIAAGTLNTNGHNLITEYDLTLVDDYPTALVLNTSYVQIGQELRAPYPVNGNASINAGTSTIELESLEWQIQDNFHNIIFTNPSPTTVLNSRLQINKLILTGSDVSTTGTLLIDTLTFENDAIVLTISDTDSLWVNEAIISTSSASSPPKLQSATAGNQVKLYNNTHNLCVVGAVDFQDINADVNGNVHAPDGTNSGNNSNIDFTSSSILTPLYWVGGTGDWDLRSNWSNVSGGCPVNKNPNTAFKLIFDDNSFFTDKDTIAVPILTNCKTLEFINTQQPAYIQIDTRMNPLQIFTSDANVHFVGAKMYIQNQTQVGANSIITLDITAGTDPKFDTPILNMAPNSELILKNSTKLIVRN